MTYNHKHPASTVGITALVMGGVVLAMGFINAIVEIGQRDESERRRAAIEDTTAYCARLLDLDTGDTINRWTAREIRMKRDTLGSRSRVELWHREPEHEGRNPDVVLNTRAHIETVRGACPSRKVARSKGAPCMRS